MAIDIKIGHRFTVGKDTNYEITHISKKLLEDTWSSFIGTNLRTGNKTRPISSQEFENEIRVGHWKYGQQD